MMNTTGDQLLALHNTLRNATALVESLLAEQTPETSNNNFRRYPRGPLNERGEAEIARRFEAGSSDSEIALAMRISLTGVSKRRWMWRKAAKVGL